MPKTTVLFGAMGAMMVGAGFLVSIQRTITSSQIPSTLRPVWQEATAAYHKFQVSSFGRR